MATLVRAKSDTYVTPQDDFLDSRIPEPFPTITRLQSGQLQEDLLEDLAQEEVNLDDEPQAGPSRIPDNINGTEELESVSLLHISFMCLLK